MTWDDYPRPRNNLPMLLLAMVAGVAIGVGLLFAVSNLRPGRNQVDDIPAVRVPDPKTDHDAEEVQSINVFTTASESVVNVDILQSVRKKFDTTVTRAIGSGSGFIWDADGHIVTNYHVIAPAIESRSRLRVVFSDRTSAEASIVGQAPDYDLAVLKVDASKEKLKPIKVGTSRDLRVGQKVFAIGNPFGLSLTMTKGIISAIDREIESPGGRPISGAIQLDAPINPGNSGGPLLDKDARLIGVNTAIASPSGGNVGIGFAVPVDTVLDIVPRIISRQFQKPDIGIKLVDQRILINNGIRSGVMVGEVTPGSPAEAAGLRGLVPRGLGTADPGDLILEADGVKISNNSDFLRALARKKIGETITLTIERDKKIREVEVKVGGI